MDSQPRTSRCPLCPNRLFTRNGLALHRAAIHAGAGAGQGRRVLPVPSPVNSPLQPRRVPSAEREPAGAGIIPLVKPLKIAASTGQPVISSTVIEAREFSRLYEMTVSHPGSVFVGIFAEFHMSGVQTTTGEVLARFSPENQVPPTADVMSLATNLITLPATSAGKHVLNAVVPLGHAAHTERALRGGQIGLRFDVVSTSSVEFRVRLVMRIRPGPQVDALNADGATVIPPPATVAPVFPAVLPGPGNPHIVESTNVPGIFLFPVRAGATMRVSGNGSWQLGDGSGGWLAVRGPAAALSAPGVIHTITTATAVDTNWVFGG